MGAVGSSQKEFTACCDAGDEYAQPEWTHLLVINEFPACCDSRDDHYLVTTPTEGEICSKQPAGMQMQRSREPEGLQLQGISEEPAHSKLPDNITFCDSQVADINKKSLTWECQCPEWVLRGRRTAWSTRSFLCEVCKKPASSSRLGTFSICSR